MAIVICGECGTRYDDVYRLTYCPHDEFPMRNVVYRPVEGRYMVLECTSLGQFAAWQKADTVEDALAMGAKVVVAENSGKQRGAD